MSKEVIYIDVNDDITSIIDNVKKSNDKIVALVPPKQIGVLHSAINLRLLAKSAKELKKYLVIITTNSSLIKLSAVAGIPVAKSLQSKPQLTPVPVAASDADDLIDGQELSVGELQQTVEPVEVEGQSTTSTSKAKAFKIPNINAFRKKIFLIGGGAFIFIAFIVWAIFFAPKANIDLYAKTKAVNIAQVATLTENSSQDDVEKNILHAQIQKLTKKKVIEVAATGEKKIGVPSSGKMTITRSLGGDVAIPAGSKFTNGDCVFTNPESATVPGRGVPVGQADPVNGQVTIAVSSTVVGDQCDLKAGPYQPSVAGVSAYGSDMTGGSSKTIKVATENDMADAKNKLAAASVDDAIKELKNKFDSSIIIINESLIKKEGEIKSSSEVDAEAPDGKLTLEQPVDYQLTGVARNKLVKYIEYLALKSNTEKTDKSQKVYETGDDKVQFSNFVNETGTQSVKVIAQSKIGPNISTDEVKKVTKGKTYGEIKDYFDALDGFEKVEVKFAPLWVRKVPTNEDRISVQFKLQ